jgi:hypothetical protein
MPGTIRRYSSQSTVDFQRAWDDDSPVIGLEARAQLNVEGEKMIRQPWISSIYGGSRLRGSTKTRRSEFMVTSKTLHSTQCGPLSLVKYQAAC